MKVKVSESSGPVLDWMVAKCEDYLKHIRLDKFKQWEDLGRTQVRDAGIADDLEHGFVDDEGHHIQYAEAIRNRGTT
jgi:hypothetical protein